jgi:hypothetical protein
MIIFPLLPFRLILSAQDRLATQGADDELNQETSPEAMISGVTVADSDYWESV